jgi:hypothetical protein
MSEATRAIVDYAAQDNAKDLRDALYSAIHDRVSAHIDAHKVEVAKNLIAPREHTQVEDEVVSAA